MSSVLYYGELENFNRSFLIYCAFPVILSLRITADFSDKPNYGGMHSKDRQHIAFLLLHIDFPVA